MKQVDDGSKDQWCDYYYTVGIKCIKLPKSDKLILQISMQVTRLLGKLGLELVGVAIFGAFLVAFAPSLLSFHVSQGCAFGNPSQSIDVYEHL